MKPLTIDELKSLEVGDWVWVVDKDDKSYYAEITAHCEDVFAIATYLTISTHFYSDYGKMWLAFKNKEQAECKGEIVELPCLRMLNLSRGVYELDFLDEAGRIKKEFYLDGDDFLVAKRRLAELKGK